jgi:hypothetical protein
MEGTVPNRQSGYTEVSTGDKATTTPPSRYGKPPDFEAVRASQRRKAAAKAFRKPDRRQGFARITEDMVPLIARIAGPATGLLLTMVQWSSKRFAQHNDGWVQLPAVVLGTIGLSDRRRRSVAVNTLVRLHALETRTTGYGKALEYRLLPVARWLKAEAGDV